MQYLLAPTSTQNHNMGIIVHFLMPSRTDKVHETKSYAALYSISTVLYICLELDKRQPILNGSQLRSRRPIMPNGDDKAGTRPDEGGMHGRRPEVTATSTRNTRGHANFYSYQQTFMCDLFTVERTSVATCSIICPRMRTATGWTSDPPLEAYHRTPLMQRTLGCLYTP